MGRKKKIIVKPEEEEKISEKMGFSRKWPIQKSEKIDKIENIKDDTIKDIIDVKESLEEPVIVIPPPQPIEPGITINEYLTNYSSNRKLDNAFIKWFMRKDATNPQMPVSKWNEQVDSFLNEVV
jgi:hypothetical protein